MFIGDVPGQGWYPSDALASSPIMDRKAWLDAAVGLHNARRAANMQSIALLLAPAVLPMLSALGFRPSAATGSPAVPPEPAPAAPGGPRGAVPASAVVGTQPPEMYPGVTWSDLSGTTEPRTYPGVTGFDGVATVGGDATMARPMPYPVPRPVEGPPAAAPRAVAPEGSASDTSTVLGPLSTAAPDGAPFGVAETRATPAAPDATGRDDDLDKRIEAIIDRLGLEAQRGQKGASFMDDLPMYLAQAAAGVLANSGKSTGEALGAGLTNALAANKELRRERLIERQRGDELDARVLGALAGISDRRDARRARDDQFRMLFGQRAAEARQRAEDRETYRDIQRGNLELARQKALEDAARGNEKLEIDRQGLDIKRAEMELKELKASGAQDITDKKVLEIVAKAAGPWEKPEVIAENARTLTRLLREQKREDLALEGAMKRHPNAEVKILSVKDPNTGAIRKVVGIRYPGRGWEQEE